MFRPGPGGGGRDLGGGGVDVQTWSGRGGGVDVQTWSQVGGRG